MLAQFFLMRFGTKDIPELEVEAKEFPQANEKTAVHIVLYVMHEGRVELFADTWEQFRPLQEVLNEKLGEIVHHDWEYIIEGDRLGMCVFCDNEESVHHSTDCDCGYHQALSYAVDIAEQSIGVHHPSDIPMPDEAYQHAPTPDVTWPDIFKAIEDFDNTTPRKREPEAWELGHE